MKKCLNLSLMKTERTSRRRLEKRRRNRPRKSRLWRKRKRDNQYRGVLGFWGFGVLGITSFTSRSHWIKIVKFCISRFHHIVYITVKHWVTLLCLVNLRADSELHSTCLAMLPCQLVYPSSPDADVHLLSFCWFLWVCFSDLTDVMLAKNSSCARPSCFCWSWHGAFRHVCQNQFVCKTVLLLLKLTRSFPSCLSKPVCVQDRLASVEVDAELSVMFVKNQSVCKTVLLLSNWRWAFLDTAFCKRAGAECFSEILFSVRVGQPQVSEKESFGPRQENWKRRTKQPSSCGDHAKKVGSTSVAKPGTNLVLLCIAGTNAFEKHTRIVWFRIQRWKSQLVEQSDIERFLAMLHHLMLQSLWKWALADAESSNIASVRPCSTETHTNN